MRRSDDNQLSLRPRQPLTLAIHNCNVVLNSDPTKARHIDSGLYGEGHSLLENYLPIGDYERLLMDIQAKAMASSVVKYSP
jgi:hypothetical protein